MPTSSPAAAPARSAPPASPRRPGGELDRVALAALLLLLLASAGAAQPGAAPGGDPAADPRLQLIQLQLQGRSESALMEVERMLATDPEAAHRLGLDYLRGRLLRQLGRDEEAIGAFLQGMSNSPWLAPYSRLQVAREQEMAHPETAAGLIATLVAGDPAFPHFRESARMLQRTLAAGGDCRLLTEIDERRLQGTERRLLLVARAGCAVKRQEPQEARQLINGLLQQERGDEPARIAAELALGGPTAGALVAGDDDELLLLAGLTLHEHRLFTRSSFHLGRYFGNSGLPIRLQRDLFDHRYALARNAFWLGQHEAAARAFEALAVRAPTPELTAKALFQQARCQELLGEWRSAIETFRSAYDADRAGDWAAAALLAALRLDWRRGREDEALELYALLRQRSRWGGMASRAALFLAASDLVRQRPDRAATWLSEAEASGGRAAAVEVAYWRGRHAELTGGWTAAVRSYLEVLQQAPYHPLAAGARRHLDAERLQRARAQVAGALLNRGGTADLAGAWLLLGESNPRGATALRRLEAALAGDRQAAPFLRLSAVPVVNWPLWREPLREPAERLLALGLWEEGAPAMDRHFPYDQPTLAHTGNLLLAGTLPHRALYRTEVLANRIPDRVPDRLLPASFRRLLYPMAYGDTLLAAARSQSVDPLLLAAIVREESRFDVDALSSAAARGLTQMTLPTAQRYANRIYANRIGSPAVEADQLYDPTVNLTLGALYLADLARTFRNAPHAMIAAYNAGEPQTRLWISYCFSKEPEEFFTKVGFRQTRDYVRKVLTSHGQYREIYPELSGR